MKDFLFNEESGQGMVEYGLIIALVSVIAIVALTALGRGVYKKFGDASAKLGETVETLPAGEH